MFVNEKEKRLKKNSISSKRPGEMLSGNTPKMDTF